MVDAVLEQCLVDERAVVIRVDTPDGPVASSRNVTENSAPGVTHGERYARYSTAVERRGFGRNIDQLVCHDASPLLHPPLERTHAGTYAGEPAESVWLSIL